MIAISLGISAYFYAMVLNKGITIDELDIILSKTKKVMPNKKWYI